LSNKIGKGLGAVFARKDLVFWGIGFGHWDKLRPRSRGVHLQDHRMEPVPMAVMDIGTSSDVKLLPDFASKTVSRRRLRVLQACWHAFDVEQTTFGLSHCTG
jgi:hypothetical protein